MKIEQRLKDIRTEQGFSQETLAELVNVSRQTISKWENGAARPSADNLAALSEAFGLPADAFLKDDWTPPEQAEPVIVEVPVPVPAPKNYRLWALLAAALISVGIVIAILCSHDWSEIPMSDHQVKVEVIDPSTLEEGISLLPPEN